VVTGLPCAYRRIETRAGGLMLFVSIADQTGLAECVLFPDAYRRWADAVRGEILSVAGRVDDVLGAITLTVERIIPQVASGARPAIASEVETWESWGR